MQEMHFPVTKIVLKAGVKTRSANRCKPVEVGLKEHDFYEVCIFPEFFFPKEIILIQITYCVNSCISPLIETFI